MSRVIFRCLNKFIPMIGITLVRFQLRVVNHQSIDGYFIVFHDLYWYNYKVMRCILNFLPLQFWIFFIFEFFFYLLQFFIFQLVIRTKVRQIKSPYFCFSFIKINCCDIFIQDGSFYLSLSLLDTKLYWSDLYTFLIGCIKFSIVKSQVLERGILKKI